MYDAQHTISSFAVAPSSTARVRRRGGPTWRSTAVASVRRHDRRQLRRADDRRDRPRRRAWLRRHPHPLRRPGVLGHHAEPVAAARRDHRDGRQLRVHDRAAGGRRRSGRPRRCRLPDADAGPRRGDAAGVAAAGRAVGLDVDRAVPRPPRRHADAERRLPRRPFGAAPRRHARRCHGPRIDAGRARRDEAPAAARDRRRRDGVLVDVVVVAQRPHRRPGSVTPRVAPRARRAVPRRR